MGSAQVPGFHPAGIGPRAKGRALGGTLRLEAGAKLLLPPPLPLPLLTHAGVRGHVWAAAGTCLANESTLRGVAGRIATAPDAASVTTLLASYIAASWGVGVTVPFPVGPGVALELNWRLGAAVPTAPGHQGVLSGSAFSARLST
ncbi:bamA [Symbiodinium sp. KB8]|nr:bamA [Symbiodinium sp. KB8]